MCEYEPKSILRLLNRRQLGLPLKEKGARVSCNRNNSRCDYELLKTLLCDCHLYLEVIACRKVSRSNQPSYCYNRLFTNNYRSWFNLCTSPTAGPSLIKTNIFCEGPQADQQQSGSSIYGPRIADAVSLNPPNGCSPLSNSQHLPCILFLCKDGWIYQYSLEDAACLNKVYVPTNVFADEVFEPDSSSCNVTEGKSDSRRRISSAKFQYQYMNINGDEGRVLVYSCVQQIGGYSYTAYGLLGLFPLRVLSHFVTRTAGTNLKVELWKDIFVLKERKGSTLALYSFEDVVGCHRINSSHVRLGRKLYLNDNQQITNLAEVGDFQIGIPYTTELIELDRWKEWPAVQLFRTKAIRHIFRVGGVPYHYAVPTDKTCTSWSLRGIADNREVSKFHVDEKWDQSHISGFDFHSDDSGRILLVNKDTVSVYKIQHSKTCGKKNFVRSREPGTSTRHRHTAPGNRDTAKIITTSPVAEPDFQLRVIGSACATPSKNKRSKYSVIKCFEINVTKDNKGSRKHSTSEDDENRVNWQYPTESNQIARSSYGRTLRQPQRYVGSQLDGSEFGVLGVSYENELDVLAVLHFKTARDGQRCHAVGEAHVDLVVSMYDNFTGAMINSVIVEQDLTPSDACGVSVILDEDTVIYTRTEMPDILNYKIMRFCRKY